MCMYVPVGRVLRTEYTDDMVRVREHDECDLRGSVEVLHLAL